MSCCIDGCEEKAKYLIEWWGLNQYGENPEVVDKVLVCENPFHIIKASYNSNFGSPSPDVIYETENYDEQPELLEDIVKTFRDLGLI